MTSLPISREKAWELVKKHNSVASDLNHYLESEAVMREVATKLGEDVDYWGTLGLVHDVDWGLTKNNVESHLTKSPEILKEAGFDDEFIEIVLSHGYGFEELPHLKDKKRMEKIQHALACSRGSFNSSYDLTISAPSISNWTEFIFLGSFSFLFASAIISTG